MMNVWKEQTPSHSRPSAGSIEVHKHSGPLKTKQLFTVLVFYCSTVYTNEAETHTEVQARGVCVGDWVSYSLLLINPAVSIAYDTFL